MLHRHLVEVAGVDRTLLLAAVAADALLAQTEAEELAVMREKERYVVTDAVSLLVARHVTGAEATQGVDVFEHVLLHMKPPANHNENLVRILHIVAPLVVVSREGRTEVAGTQCNERCLFVVEDKEIL